jgi:hypothetical protein
MLVDIKNGMSAFCIHAHDVPVDDLNVFNFQEE